MTNYIKTTIECALSNYRGDDLERARLAFRGCTPDQMAQQYGHSGQTRQQIVDGYQAHVDRVTAAQNWLASQDMNE